MTYTTPVFGLTVPDSESYLDQLGVELEATVLRLEEVLKVRAVSPGDIAPRVAALEPTAWTTPTLSAAKFGSYTTMGESPVGYRREGYRVAFRGMLEVKTQTAVGDVVFTLPPGMRPPAGVRRHLPLPVAAAAGGQYRLYVGGQAAGSDDGTVRCLYAIPANTFLVLDSVTMAL